MYLGAERVALANETITETFEQSSLAWRAFPHWETGDRGQTRVPTDIVNNTNFLPIDTRERPFQLTLVQANAPTPDSMLAEVITETGNLAGVVDGVVLQAVYNGKGSQTALPAPNPNTLTDILKALIEARADIEDAGYRAPSCLITNTDGLIALSELVGGYPVMDAILKAANVNALYRATTIDAGLAAGKKLFVLIGRRQLIADGGAPQASPGEEPVDIAVSVCPGLEVVGEAANSEIEVSVRISFATRIKDARAVIAVVDP